MDLQAEAVKQARWRSIGPANMGGRIADIAVDEKNPYTFYIALASGGLLKTNNNGNTWTPAFDKEAFGSLGAVAIAPSDSKIVWAGTGEANGRNSSSWGGGVYLSTDAGATWKNMGLQDTHHIARIVIDPNDPKTVYVAAAGHLWGANKERGIFKTVDGGKTWQHSLAIDADTGAIDVALGAPDSRSGGIVYAAMYQRRRTPWGLQAAGPGSGLYKSTDAGKSWKKLTGGLPTGPLGRIGLSVSRSKPNTLYAVIENQEGGPYGAFDNRSKRGGVFRSDDAGETWKRLNSNSPRGFYFGQIRVDPTNAERVYVLGFDLAVSDDGGKTFKEDDQFNVHSDLHALWIDPSRPERLLLGTDGGLYASYDQSKTWESINNFPMGQFYEVAMDNRSPFWVYGGLQDNGSWTGPSALEATNGPMNMDWDSVGDGDGFYVIPDPIEPQILYSESQGGHIARVDRRNNKVTSIFPEASEGTPGFRFNWNTPFCLSHYDRTVLYVGGNRLFKWTNSGTIWEPISPDLSKQVAERITSVGSGAETYGTIVTLAESPLKRDLIWAGTDDGNVQVTQDEGKTWTDVTHNLPGRVRDLYVTRVEASHFVEGRAYVAIDGHRSDRFETLLFATEDYGKSWRSIVGDLPANGPVHAIREDPVNPDLLFAGTEFGCFVSFDRGGRWHKLDNGLPTVPVFDLAIHPRDHALVAATHGRSIYVMDNIVPLQQLTPKVREMDLYLFPMRSAHEFLPGGHDSSGSHDFKAANPPSGVEIVYWLRSLSDIPPAFAITDAAGKSVANLTGERTPGLNRLYWNMQKSGLFVKPGTYTITMTLGDKKLSQPVQVTGDPHLSEPDPDAIGGPGEAHT